jgi:hypothetical protein
MPKPESAPFARKREPLHPALATAIVGGGLLLLTLTVLMALLLAELHDSGDHIASQDRKVSAVYRAARPLVEEAEPAAEQAVPLLKDARPVIRRLGPLARSAQETLEPLEPAAPAVVAAIKRLGPLSSAGLRLTAVAVPVLEQLNAADIAFSLATVRELAGRLSDGDRLVQLVDETRSLIAEVTERSLPRKADRSSHRLAEILRIQRMTLAVQRRALRVQRRSKAIQAESLVHIESIDDKTGGPVPPTTGNP